MSTDGLEQNNGKVTDAELLKLSDLEIGDVKKYTDEDRKRREDLLMLARHERYKKDPSKFVELSEIVACVKRSPIGPMIFIGAQEKIELQLAWAELNQKCMDVLHAMDLENAMKKQANIHKPGAGFMQSLRSFRKKR